MNDYVVPKEVIEWAKWEINCSDGDIGMSVDYNVGYEDALKTFLNKINVVYTKDTE